jgi:two-component system, NarL family, captular synthesis response regulator RcsB
MIDRVLIAEDHESANISIQKTLRDLGIEDAAYVYYCDDALAKIKTACQQGKPFDLLITDIFFEEDSQVQRLADGMELIAAARKEHPELKVLVFSAENRPATLEFLYNKLQVDGYVRKARNDSKELLQAIHEISQNRQYFPRHVSQLIRQKNSHDFTDFDITIISLLANGVPQKNIPIHLEQQKIKPSGLSSVEKRLNHIKGVLDFSKNEQLVAFCKDMGII